MRKEGQITVFLSLILLCVFSLILGLLESARTAGARCYLQVAADSSIDSVFSQYHRPLWDRYRLLLLEYDSPEEIEGQFADFIRPYEEVHNWYPVKLGRAEVTQLKTVTDDSGLYLEQEIKDYMKYGIWDLDFDPAHAQELMKELKEAGSVKAAAKAYTGHTKEAVKLEEALEAIAGSVAAQEECRRRAASCLASGNGAGFRRETAKIKKEIRRFPALVKTYTQRADKLGEGLVKSREEFSALQSDLSPSVRDSFLEEISHYEEYTAQDGKRRTEIVGTASMVQDNLPVVERAEERAGEVEDIIEEWEDSDDEDDDPPDEDALWESVSRIFREIKQPELSFSPGVKDKEKQKLLERLVKLVDAGLLSLILPDSKDISDGTLNPGDLVSSSHREGDGGVKDSTLIDRLVTDEYCIQFFSNYLSPERKEVQYETEYLIGGKYTDEENLSAAVRQLLLLREGMNMVYLLSDMEKREEARTLALTVTGAVGLVPLVSVVTFFIMGAWALGEAAEDVKALLEGRRIPLLKTKETWTLSLDALLDMGRDQRAPGAGGGEEGLDYDGYLRLLLFLEQPVTKYFRMMDIIQMNIKREQEGFQMERCAYSVDIRARFDGKHLFFNLGQGKSRAGTGGDRYPITVSTQKAF